MTTAEKESSPPSPSVPRRLVREVAVQLLHSSLAQPDSEQERADPWPLILAQQEGKIIRCRARAILHLQQNRAGRAKPFLQSRGTALPLLENYLDSKAPSKAFRQLFGAEEALPDLLDLLKRQLKSEKEPDAIASTIDRIAAQNLTSRSALKELSAALGQPSHCPAPLLALAKAIAPLQASADLLQSLLSPTPPDLRELTALRTAMSERDALKNESLALHTLILQHLPESDRLLAEKLKNFAPDRLGKVDRAVLRLALTELNHCPEIPPAVTINEAIEIARRFGDIESAGFVNGLLDKLIPEQKQGQS